MEIMRQKNVATRIVFPIVDADGDFVTGATGLDSELDQWADGANPTGFADCTNEATEIGATGIYYLNLTQGEMNEDYIVVQIKTSSSGAKTQMILINTYPATTITSRASQASLDTVDDFLDTEVAAIKAKTDQLVFTTANRVDSSVIDKTGFSLSAAGVQAIWDALTAALTTANSIGKLLVDNINATISSRASQTSLDTVDDFLDTEIAAILADTNELQTDWADGGRLDLILDARASQASVNTIDDFLDTEIADILADTNELQTDWVNGGRLDLLIDAIKAKTDNLPADPADASDIASSFTTVNTKLDTIDDFLDTEIAAIKAKTDNLPEGIKKNTALSSFMFMMIDSTDDVSAKTGLTVTAERSIDGGAFAGCANAVTEVAEGWYKIDLAAADLNGDVIALKFTAAGANATNITIKTEV